MSPVNQHGNNRTNDEKILEAIEELRDQVTELNSLNRIQSLKLEESALIAKQHEAKINEMMTTFNSARGIMWFIRTCAAVAITVGTIWISVRELFSFKFGG